MAVLKEQSMGSGGYLEHRGSELETASGSIPGHTLPAQPVPANCLLQVPPHPQGNHIPLKGKAEEEQKDEEYDGCHRS